MVRLRLCLLLLLIGACAPAPLGPSPTPSPGATPTPAPVDRRSFQRRYTIAHNQVPLGNSSPLMARLAAGQIALVGIHALPQNGIGKLVLTLVSEQDGTPLWSKHFEMAENFQLSGLTAHGDDLYIHGLLPPEGPRPQDRNSTLKDLNVLKVSAAGEIQWHKTFKMPLFGYSFTNHSQMIATAADELALIHYDRVYLMNPQGEIRAGRAFSGRVYDVQRLPNGDYVVNHLKLEPGYTQVFSGFQLTGLNPDMSVQWRKFYAGDLSGTFSLSRLHPLGNQRFHMAFGVNDMRVKTRIGLGHVIVNAQGELLQSFSELTRADGPELFFTEIHQSLATDNAIYINASHGSGGSAPVRTLTFQYNLEGQFQALRSNPSGSLVVAQSQLFSTFPQRAMLRRYAFQLAASPFTQGLCEPEIATLERKDTFAVQVNDHTVEPTVLDIPAVTAGAARTVTLATGAEPAVCPN